MPQTTYICGHTWKTGIVARNTEEEERLKKIVERWSQTEKCAFCKIQDVSEDEITKRLRELS